MLIGHLCQGSHVSRKVAVSRAASLLGISRHELQRLIHDGELVSYDGRLDLDQLRERFPTLELAESSLNQELKLLKQTAFALRIKDVAFPDAEELATQLHQLRVKLAVTQAREEKYSGLLKELGRRLSDLYSECDDVHRRHLAEINRWLLRELEK